MTKLYTLVTSDEMIGCALIHTRVEEPNGRSSARIEHGLNLPRYTASEVVTMLDDIEVMPPIVDTSEDIPENAQITYMINLYRARMQVARKSRRGAANAYFLVDDGIIMFYRNTAQSTESDHITMDGPFARFETDQYIVVDKAITNGVTISDYFVKLPCDPKSPYLHCALQHDMLSSLTHIE